LSGGHAWKTDFLTTVRYNDKRSGYGSTSYPDDRPDQLGKYKDNELIADVKKDSRRVFMLRLSKLKDRANYALVQAQKAAETAAFKADVAAARFHQHSVTKYTGRPQKTEPLCLIAHIFKIHRILCILQICFVTYTCNNFIFIDCAK